MIVSASRRTDVPAFYGPWFLNRLRAGYCKTVNPFNRRQVSMISLRRADVDGIVFWTKDVGPFLAGLAEVHERGYPFVLQYTINGYPRALESRVVDARRSADHLRAVADAYGPRVAVWRYDTIVTTTLTDRDFHRRNFEALAARLAGATDEVVVSFAQLYRKTRTNTDAAAREHGFGWSDPPADEKRALLRELAAMAAARGMRLTVCSQPELLVEGIGPSRCVDADRLSAVAGRSIAAREKGTREGCRCSESRDVGAYDSCPHGCVYCYAVQSRGRAMERYRGHDPEGELLLAANGGAVSGVASSGDGAVGSRNEAE